MQFSESEILLISELLIKILSDNIKQKTIQEEKIISFVSEIEDNTDNEMICTSESDIIITPDVKKRRGRPCKTVKKN